jgi:hypothetical protein
MAINPILMNDLPYDTAKDFAPVSLTHLTPYVFVVSEKSPISPSPSSRVRARKPARSLRHDRASSLQLS